MLVAYIVGRIINTKNHSRNSPYVHKHDAGCNCLRLVRTPNSRSNICHQNPDNIRSLGPNETPSITEIQKKLQSIHSHKSIIEFDGPVQVQVVFVSEAGGPFTNTYFLFCIKRSTLYVWPQINDIYTLQYFQI